MSNVCELLINTVSCDERNAIVAIFFEIVDALTKRCVAGYSSYIWEYADSSAIGEQTEAK